MSNFVERFKNELENEKLTLQSFSKITGISSSQLSKYASGFYEPSLKNAIIICNSFSCSIDYLCGLNKDRNNFGALKSENVELFFKRFNNLLKINNTNINRVSKHTSINRNCIYHWQNKHLFPKLGILIKLSIELHTNIEYLIGRTDVMEISYGI